ncbi:MAG: D-glycero-beta-D-manno-heptose-7-phosphate kinase [candidate division KSB1 bacterium]|nr:D-glycero-beta-D-manno-heptose-7-phosphate kinase [candidate division KSB1 bacterium]MDZ7337969.1 D-glycero-beta-D-manno-heptose-7-phosphate kinase [candidate division KSB1 bacterium]MDZ7385178.1 D-glycero-beta-D-manno-heptose-7-phosphate kinase [candidate division KSB1 bacterium]MDZ7392905.1 D-glycero-beta-D-manno-heptose-7-phosphate kinase [candidate division KSB1 bacterium]MDZ7412684.1 D-glycero-beta-D-manno-heptose-7-phosphate kinase [candidate division KSB1 bacterium]
MISLAPARVRQLFDSFAGLRIVVLGDVMLDRYIWGSVERISPEAPVPVVVVEEESARLGGAANVAHNLASLGATPIPVGVVGEDQHASALRQLMEELGFATDGVLSVSGRGTTVKTRVIAHNQHVVRIDRETRAPIAKEVCDRLLAFLADTLPHADGIIIEDYNKGLITSPLIAGTLALARAHQVPVMVDPKFDHFFEYQGVCTVKPNRRETEEVLGTRLSGEGEVHRAGTALLERLGCENVLLTLGADGMYLFERSGRVAHVPTRARKVHDVSGAGDTVISVFTAAYAAGASAAEAATIANYAAGLVCEEVGVVPVDREQLMRILLDEQG